MKVEDTYSQRIYDKRITEDKVMQCKNCGTINEGNSKFCKKCGAQLEKGANDSSNIEKVKSKGEKKQGIFGKIVVIAIGVVLILFLRMMLKGDKAKFDSVENVIAHYESNTDFQDYFFNVKEKRNIGSIDSMGFGEWERLSMDGTVYAGGGSYENKLFLINENDIVEVSDDAYSFEMSINGNKLVYVDGKGALFLYDSETMTTDKIANFADERGIVVSPNGESIAYVDQENKSTLCVYSKDKVIEIGENLLPIALPDSGEYIYCYNTENKGIYVKFLDGESKKIGTGKEMNSLYLNKEHTQLLFRSNNNYYVSDEGSDKIKLFSECFSLDGIMSHKSYEFWANNHPKLLVITYPISDLRDMYYTSGTEGTEYDNLYYVDENWNSIFIEKDITDIRYIDESGKNLSYLKTGNKLYKIENGNYKNAFWVADDVINFVMTSDGEDFYYIDSENTLWFKKGRKEEQKIADDVYDLYITHDDYALFLAEDDVLYSSYQGKEKKRIADDVYGVSVGPLYAEYCINYNVLESNDSWEVYTGDLYLATEKTDFVLMFEDVRKYFLHI